MKLRPCPKCGGEELISAEFPLESGWSIHCDSNVGGGCGLSVWGPDEKEAERRWNCRPLDAQEIFVKWAEDAVREWDGVFLKDLIVLLTQKFGCTTTDVKSMMQGEINREIKEYHRDPHSAHRPSGFPDRALRAIPRLPFR